MALAALGELALGALPPPITVAVRLRRVFSLPVLSAFAVGLLFVVSPGSPRGPGALAEPC
jgi:hypothetical protein